MKIEKKLVALSILAFAIGIATILPMSTLMNVKAQTYDDPWFNIEVPYVYFEANTTDDNAYQYLLNVLAIQPSVNYNALNRDLEGRIEYLEYTIYTDDIQLSKNTYCLSINNADKENLIDSFSFCKDYYFNSSYFDTSSDNDNYNGYHIKKDLTQLPSILSTGSISCVSENEFKDICAVLENTQTIYIDVKRVGYVTFDGDNTVVTLADKQAIHHIELTKNGDTFTFGDKESTVINWFLLRIRSSDTFNDSEFPLIPPLSIGFYPKNQTSR